MPCPHSGSGGDRDRPVRDRNERGIERRSFMKSALVIGGTSALTTVTGMYGVPETAAASTSVGLGERLNRQHSWDAFEAQARGTTVPPPYHLLLHMNYLGDGTPSGEDRAAVEGALRGLERGIGWGHDGVLFTLGYSGSYFGRFDDPLPEGLAGGDTRLVDPETTIEAIAAPHEDPAEIAADRYDAVLHVASDHVQHLLAAEAALWGEDTEVVSLEDTFEGVFSRPTEYPARRSGFAGVTKQKYEEAGKDVAEHIPEESALAMGFNPLYENSVPREELATMLENQKLTDPAPPGVFAQGTVAHVSKLTMNLEDWYENNSLDERRTQMFSPHHDGENTGEVGENLGTTNDAGDLPARQAGSDERDIAERTAEDAEEHGITGHVQKMARARFDVEQRQTGEPAEDPDDQVYETPILRRDVDTLDDDVPGLHFVALMRFNGYMHYVRQAMNGTEFDTAVFGLTGEDRIAHESIVDDVTDDGPGNQNNGLVPYLDTERRGNYLVPPLSVRALPPARAVRLNEGGDGFWVETEVSQGSIVTWLAGTDDLDPGAVDPATARFGPPEVVNRGGGAPPVDARLTGRGLRLTFDAGDAGFSADDDRGRLFAKTTVEDGRRPVFATDDVRTGGGGGGNGSGGGGGNGSGGGRGNGSGGGRGNGSGGGRGNGSGGGGVNGSGGGGGGDSSGGGEGRNGRGRSGSDDGRRAGGRGEGRSGGRG